MLTRETATPFTERPSSKFPKKSLCSAWKSWHKKKKRMRDRNHQRSRGNSPSSATPERGKSRARRAAGRAQQGLEDEGIMLTTMTIEAWCEQIAQQAIENEAGDEQDGDHREDIDDAVVAGDLKGA